MGWLLDLPIYAHGKFTGKVGLCVIRCNNIFFGKTHMLDCQCPLSLILQCINFGVSCVYRDGASRQIGAILVLGIP
jgi:hypothetical protein